MYVYVFALATTSARQLPRFCKLPLVIIADFAFPCCSPLHFNGKSNGTPFISRAEIKVGVCVVLSLADQGPGAIGRPCSFDLLSLFFVLKKKKRNYICVCVRARIYTWYALQSSCVCSSANFIILSQAKSRSSRERPSGEVVRSTLRRNLKNSYLPSGVVWISRRSE